MSLEMHACLNLNGQKYNEAILSYKTESTIFAKYFLHQMKTYTYGIKAK